MNGAADAPPGLLVLSPGALDLGATVLGLLFVAWGWWRGALCAFAWLVGIAAAGALARALGPWIAGPLDQAFDIAPSVLASLAWAVALLGVLLALGILTRAFGGWLPARETPGRVSRALGALLGAAIGSFALLLLSYVLLQAAVPATDRARFGRDATLLDLLVPLRPAWASVLNLPAEVERVAERLEAEIHPPA